MAVTVSGLYVQNFIDVFDASQLPINLTTAADLKVALLAQAATVNFDTDTAWSNTNEVIGTGWVTTGILFSAAAAGASSMAPTLTVSPTGTMMWDANDVAVSSTTITNAFAARMYADAVTTPTADPLIVLINFTAAFSTNNGTFGIQFASTGIFALDLTP